MTPRLKSVSVHSTVLLLTIASTASISAAEPGPHMATGFKIGEVTDTTAIIWTRLTEHDKANPKDGPMIEIVYDRPNRSRRNQAVEEIKYPPGATVRTLRNAAPGRGGEVRIEYKPESKTASLYTEWKRVDPNADFTRQFTLKDLLPNTHYAVRVVGRGKPGTRGLVKHGHFWTAPSPDAAEKVVFTVSTGQAFGDQDRPDGFQIYPTMQKLRPNFFVHTGDIVYYDRLAKNRELANYHWQRTYSLPTNVKFHMNVASYFIKDDHDTWVNDCWPTMKSPYMGDLTFEQGLKIFPQQVPMGESTYRTRRWGKDLQIWLVEGRDFRRANTAPDGPSKTIWGEKQKAWFKRTVRESDAAFRVLISPTPIVGPDRDSKHDNHSNKDFTHEGDEIRTFLASQKNMIVICGDRHWQYHSVHPTTKVREYSCGPASDKHAGGWRKDDFRDNYHQYLNVIGGFLSVTAERKNEKPTLAMRFHDVQGKVKHEDVLTAD